MTAHSTDLTNKPGDDPVFQSRLAVLRQRFVERTRQDALAIAGLRGRWEAGEPLDGILLKEMIRTMHGLAGAAGVFGFAAISDAAHRLEEQLLGAPVDQADLGPLLDALDAELALILAADPRA